VKVESANVERENKGKGTRLEDHPNGKGGGKRHENLSKRTAHEGKGATGCAVPGDGKKETKQKKR
jgi:hypothetical protein